jgi:hypothetical protein
MVKRYRILKIKNFLLKSVCAVSGCSLLFTPLHAHHINLPEITRNILNVNMFVPTTTQKHVPRDTCDITVYIQTWVSSPVSELLLVSNNRQIGTRLFIMFTIVLL